MCAIEHSQKVLVAQKMTCQRKFVERGLKRARGVVRQRRVRLPPQQRQCQYQQAKKTVSKDAKDGNTIPGNSWERAGQGIEKLARKEGKLGRAWDVVGVK